MRGNWRCETRTFERRILVATRPSEATIVSVGLCVNYRFRVNSPEFSVFISANIVEVLFIARQSDRRLVRHIISNQSVIHCSIRYRATSTLFCS